MSDKGATPSQGNFEPGWNDPPKLQYVPTSVGKPKLNLNKRVAFPLQGGASQKPTAVVQPSPSSLPLTMLSTQPQPPVAVVPPMTRINSPPTMKVSPLDTTPQETRLESAAAGVEEAENLNSEEARAFCMETFLHFASKIHDSNSIKSDEVQRRINLINQMWLSRTLNTAVHRKLYNIAKALKSNNFSDAIENHRALVVGHSSVCPAWGAALRQIILTIQQTRDNSNSTAIGTHQGSIQTITDNILIPTAITGDIASNQTESENASNVQHL